jgi:hypothetical protein
MRELAHRFRDALGLRERAGGDSPRLSEYALAMARGQPYIQLKLEVDQPLEMGDFVSAFTSLGAEYDRFVRAREPDSQAHATLYVRDVKQGSIIALLIPVLTSLPSIADAMSQAVAIEDFVRRYGARLLLYTKPGGRAADATGSELKDFSEQVAAIAHNPNSRIEVAAIEIVDGDHRVKAAFQFGTQEARTIQEQVEVHRYEIEHATGGLHERVLMTFTRSDIRTTAVGKRSGEQVVIESVSPGRSLPIIYASEMAEQQIKYEITEAEDNVFKKGFIVDVIEETRASRLVGYRITNLHQVIDLPDND